MVPLLAGATTLARAVAFVLYFCARAVAWSYTASVCCRIYSCSRVQVAPTRARFVTRAKLVNKLTTRANNFWGRYGSTAKARTRARLVTLRSLNWPDNYDELSSPERKGCAGCTGSKDDGILSGQHVRGP